MKPSVERSLNFGLQFSVVGFAVGFYITATTMGNYPFFYIYSTFAAFVTQFSAWYLLVERPRRFTTARTASAGALGALLSHYVCWYCFLISANIQHWIFGIRLGSLGEEPIDLISGLLYMWVFTFFSWLFTGWVTVPAGAFLGIRHGRQIRKENG